MSFRVGEVVLKRVHDVDEAEWTQGLLSRIEPEGYRIARPLATIAREWVADGWSASRFIDGLRSATPAWGLISKAGLRLADDAEEARDGGREVLSQRSHRWAVADRVAWEEADAKLDSEAAEVHALLSALLGRASSVEHFVHGDLSGNVLLDRASVPVILDVSPYLRPRDWGTAIVVADAVLWNGAAISLMESLAATSSGLDLLGRALIFRLVAEQLADDPRHGGALEPYRRVLAALG